MTSGVFYKKTIDDVPLKSKTVLVRTDYNVPLTKDCAVSDDYRLKMSLPTIQALLKDGCKVVIVSHLGRPGGKLEPRYSLEPVALRLAELLGEPVRFIDRTIGYKVKMAIKRAPKHSVTMLENIRFHPEEEANDTEFARQLAADTGAELFVQDGFGVAHRTHASTSAITRYLPGVAGRLIKHEYEAITESIRQPKRPLVAVLGGSKVSDKIGVIKALIDVADTIIIGGAMANTFLARRGISIGDSTAEVDQSAEINAIYEKAAQKVGRDRVDSFIILPVDVGVGTSLKPTATRQDVSVRAIPTGGRVLDLGPETIGLIESIIVRARTVIWNGTLGYTEVPAFRTASASLAQVLVDHNDQIFSLIGGGDTTDFVRRWDGFKGEGFDHISTGGGATLELMSGRRLPGIDALLDA